MSVSREKLLRNYRAELASALAWKAEGRISVDGSGDSETPSTAGPGLSKGRAVVPIDEYIQSWRNGIEALESGADPELWNY